MSIYYAADAEPTDRIQIELVPSGDTFRSVYQGREVAPPSMLIMHETAIRRRRRRREAVT
jgi:hypothetical protein